MKLPRSEIRVSFGWLFPEWLTHNEKGHRILDLRLQTCFAFEYLSYDEGDTWYLVLQVLGFGICVNLLKGKKNITKDS
jgi:hypothetical protein